MQRSVPSPTKTSRKARRLAAALFLLLLLIPVSALAEMVSIGPNKARLRSGPGTGHEILWVLDPGYPLKVVARKGQWLKVVDFENDNGWVHKSLTTRQAHLIVKVAEATIRSGPGTGYRVVGTAMHGVVLRTLKRQQGWVRVGHTDGLTGWIRRDLLWGW
ncbi:MAG: SH3 domain-containing protein [Thermodesulfobacteriota bacterium]